MPRKTFFCQFTCFSKDQTSYLCTESKSNLKSILHPCNQVLRVICAWHTIWSDGRTWERCHLPTLWDLSEIAQNTSFLRPEEGMDTQLYRCLYINNTHTYIFKMGLGKIICCLRVFQWHNIGSGGLLLWRLSKFPSWPGAEVSPLHTKLWTCPPN